MLLVTEILPGVITPVPLEKIAVRLAELPVVMVEALVTKLDIAGAEPTVTVAVLLTALPTEFVTVRV